ncbi:DUF4421 domain-containing protein [Flagellimonas hadalis]|uniref:DUF4421 domain-containing protein n=2 Tax=Flagellimonas hadalis TaxID=2597517 RepID=A0A5N5J5K0_9FLAO|nr:DUF4421 domain-containing protein [Allomuricauda hadalis]
MFMAELKSFIMAIPSFILMGAYFFCAQAQGQLGDSTSVRSYVDKLSFGIDLGTDFDEFLVDNPDVGYFHLVTNNNVKLTLGLDYDFLSLSVGLAPKFLPGNDDDELKGKSSFQNYQVNVFPGRLVQNVFFRRMKGFYVENTSDFLPTWSEGDPHLQFPDLKSITWGGSTGLVLNKDFSLRALLNRQEWQLESRGSLVPMIQYEFTKMTNNFEDNTYGKENIVDLRVGVGYYYNWVVASKFNMAPSLRVGIGPKFSKYTLSGEVEKNDYLVAEYGAGIQLGYNTDHFYMGIIGELDGTSYRDSDSNAISNNLWRAVFYVGYRLEPPKKLNDFFDRNKPVIGKPR